MRIWSFLLIPAFAGLALGQSKPPHAQAPSKQAAVPLQLSVRIDRQTYRMSDSMKMETQITNIGNDDVYLYDWNLCWNFARWLKIPAQIPVVQLRDIRDGFPFSCCRTYGRFAGHSDT